MASRTQHEMEPVVRTLVDISDSKAALSAKADMMLERGRWASQVFQRYDRAATMRIVDAVAQAAHDNAGRFAEAAVAETGFGVAAHKTIKNELTAKPLVDFYRDEDFVSPKIDEARKIVAIPRPAGVIVALSPSTNPIATINFKVLLALMTRNAVVVSPHPAARACAVEACRVLSEAAAAAGAPDGVIQVIEEPTIPLIEVFMSSPKTSVVLATGGTAMVRAAYSSSNPAIGVGPGNAPVFVDSSAKLDLAAKRIVDSKSFDNSILCTNESTLITLEEVDQKLRRALQGAGAYLCSEEETERLRRYLFHAKAQGVEAQGVEAQGKVGFNIEALGRDAAWIAKECGIKVPGKTRILVTPITQIGVEEPLSREKLCPVMAYTVARNRSQAIAQSRALLRMTGAGHSAAVHAMDESVAFAFASAVECYRVVVNAPCSQGAAGFGTNLAPSFTIGTGYFGRSSIGENIGPQHLVHWTRMAYNADASEPMGNYHGLSQRLDGPLPEAPSDGVPGSPRPRAPGGLGDLPAMEGLDEVIRAELRQLIAEELRTMLKK